MPDYGSIGKRRDLRARLGGTMTPQLLSMTVPLGVSFTPETTEVVAVLYARESDSTPMVQDGFVVEELTGSTPQELRFLLTLPKERVTALNALAAPLKTASSARTPAGGVRVLFWACFFQDPLTARMPLYYGRLSIYQGAVGA